MGRTLTILFLLLTGLSAQAQKEKSFTILKEPRQHGPIALNGIYLKKGTVKWSQSFSMYFFSNGVFFSSVEHNSYITAKDDQDFINILTQVDVEKNSGMYWGFYTVKDDTLIAQKRTLSDDGVRWMVLEEKCLLKEGRIYKLTYKRMPPPLFKKSQEIPTEDTAAFVFYPTTIKPDSSRAWFYNVDWYQKYK